MYKAANGFVLLDSMTPGGWPIREAQDIVKALEAIPAFQTVAAPFIWRAIEQATADRKVYADIKDLAGSLLKSYI